MRALTLSALDFQGNARAFLKGQITIHTDFEGVRYCALLNIKARVICTAWLWNRGNQTHLIVASDMVEEIRARLAPIAQLSGVTITLSNQSFYGGFSNHPTDGFALPFGSVHTSDQDVEPEAWHIARIKAVYPFIDVKNARITFAHYLNLPSLGAVDFDKGCYVGQEVVSRMHFKTDVNKHTYYMQGDYTAGQVLENGLVLEAVGGHALAILKDTPDLHLPYTLIE